MWYPRDGALEDLLSQCAKQWECSVEEAAENMVFIYNKEKITNYQDFLLREEKSEYFMNSKTHEIKLYVLIDKNTHYYNRLDTQGKREYTRIRKQILVDVHEGCPEKDIDEMTIRTHQGYAQENYATGYWDTRSEALSDAYGLMMHIHDDKLSELFDRWCA